MYIHLPPIDWVPVIGGPLLAAGLFVAALARAARTTRVRSNESRSVITGVILFLAAWFTAYAYLAGRGVFSSPAPFPTLPIGLLLPLIVAFFALKAFPNLRAIVENVPQDRLIGIQTIRLMGFAFLLLLAQSLLPKVFALPAGLGDMFVGVEAIYVARLYARRAGTASTMGLLWNVIGNRRFRRGAYHWIPRLDHTVSTDSRQSKHGSRDYAAAGDGADLRRAAVPHFARIVDESHFFRVKGHDERYSVDDLEVKGAIVKL